MKCHPLYVSGLETVKSLQMEPQLKHRYNDYLADYLRSGFNMKQIANTYNTVANGLEQLMTVLILVVGAYTIMNSSTGSEQAEFSIGMLVALLVDEVVRIGSLGLAVVGEVQNK